MAGIHSFDFLGLGYRVEWPVTIILTSGALKIYSNIFNFLIQVKLAVFSLSDTWRLLKVMFCNLTYASLLKPNGSFAPFSTYSLVTIHVYASEVMDALIPPQLEFSSKK